MYSSEVFTKILLMSTHMFFFQGTSNEYLQHILVFGTSNE